MDAGTGLVHTAPGHGEEDYEVGRKRRAQDLQPGGRRRALHRRGGALRRPHRLGGEPAHHRAPAGRGALVARGVARSTPIRTAGAARTRRSSAPPSSGSSRSTRHGLRAAGARGDPQRGAVDPRLGRGAHPQHGRAPAGLVHLAPAGLGRADRRLLLHGLRRAAARASALVEHVAAIYRAQGAGADEWYVREAARAAAAGHALREVRRRRASARRPTSSTLVRLRLQPRGGARARARSCAGPPSCTSRARDQHRGWFHSSLLEAVGTRDRAALPRRRSPTASWSTATGGRCRSRCGNVIAPDELIRQVRRRGPAPVGGRRGLHGGHPPLDEILNRLADAYRRIRNTCRFLLGNLADFDPERDRRSYDADGRARPLGPRCAWATSIARVRKAYEDYQFHAVFHALHNFCAVDLSALYLDIIKDRLYTSAPDDPRRRAAQTVCFELLTALTRLMAPILTFTADEVWRHIPGRGKPESVHLELFPEERGEWLDERLGGGLGAAARGARRGLARARDRARQQRQIGKGSTRCVSSRARRRSSGARCSRPRARPCSRRSSSSRGRGSASPRPPAPSATRARTSPGLVLEVVPAQALGGRSASAAGPGARGWGSIRRIPTLCERCAPVVTALATGDVGRPLTALAVLVLDQLTKVWALQGLAPGPARAGDRRLLLPHARDESGPRLRACSRPRRRAGAGSSALLSIGALAVLAVVGLRDAAGRRPARPRSRSVSSSAARSAT